MKKEIAEIILENGQVFPGFVPNEHSFGVSGEVVFSTGMTGYVESLTDPSYTGQILTFTYPLIGNYGIPSEERWESSRIRPRAVVLGEACEGWSHYQGKSSLLDWLFSQGVPCIQGVDTRALTKTLRDAGVMRGGIVRKGEKQSSFADFGEHCFAQEVTIQEKRVIQEGGKKRVIVVDNGIKGNILRCLQKFPVTLIQVPYDYDYTEEEFDAVFLSNGPGNPRSLQKGVDILKKTLTKEKPVFGVCMGIQLLALAVGASTYKLPYGHRGQNQPCMDLKSRRCFITSQNHGYAIDAKTLPKEWEICFQNLNDGTVEGICHKELPYFAVQFHPEACPGPTDTEWLFEQFMEQVGV